jgi:subtilisin family serine protease
LEKINEDMHLRIGVKHPFYLETMKRKTTSMEPKIEVKQFSYFRAPITNIQPKGTVTILDVFRFISTDFKMQTEQLRSIHDPVKARAFKAANFNYVTFSGSFKKRNDKHLIAHSGLMALDFDHLPNTAELKQLLLKDAYFDTELGAIDDRFGFNAIRNDADPMDENGHGTHVAGILGAEGDNGIGITGINWEVQILPLKFMGANGSGTTKDAIEAINYAIDRKRRGVNIRVINASWGSGVYSRALEDVIRSAAAEGILFVAAAGNSSSDNDRIPHYPSNYRLPNVISVAATDESDNLAGFSSYGGKSVHISAPGRNILSTWLGGEYKEASGTSMAAPQVAGIAALILSLDSDMGLIELKETLLKSHDPNPSFSGKLLNAGRISAAKALGE